LEGGREAGGTNTCPGAIAKQKTAEPQGAVSLLLAVLESDGRKREVPIDSSARWELAGEGENPRQITFGVSQSWRLVIDARVWWTISSCFDTTFAATAGIAGRMEE
jgi:hypothetical protein